jgi:uncharacterized protein YbjT (DUF2867 family)
MRIAIVGGTGTLGGHVVTELRSRGHEVRVLSRSAPQYRVDLLTGAGLGPALEGCERWSTPATTPRRAAAVLVGGTRRLLDAEQAAGVRHHVCVSIVGCDQLTVVAFTVDRGRITALDAIRNPDKLTALPEAGPGAGRAREGGPGEISGPRPPS